MGMRRIRTGIMGKQGIRVGMRGIRVGIKGIRVGMIGMQGIRVGMSGIRVRVFVFMSSAKIPERERSISLSNFDGQLPDH